MFVNYFSPFAPWYDSVIVDDGCLSTVGNDGSERSVAENTILSERGDSSLTEQSGVPALDSVPSADEGVTWCDFVVRVDNNGSIENERMSSEGGTAEGLDAVPESKILAKLKNGND